MMIYDLRQTKLASVTQVYQPSHIKFLSRFTTKCCIVSRNGRFSIVDLANPSTIKYVLFFFNQSKISFLIINF